MSYHICENCLHSTSTLTDLYSIYIYIYFNSAIIVAIGSIRFALFRKLAMEVVTSLSGLLWGGGHWVRQQFLHASNFVFLEGFWRTCIMLKSTKLLWHMRIGLIFTLTFDLLIVLWIGIICSSGTIYLPSLKILEQSILELSVAQGVGDQYVLWHWPLI